jgi:maltose/maltodextrin transport system substrate-binding protein
MLLATSGSAAAQDAAADPDAFARTGWNAQVRQQFMNPPVLHFTKVGPAAGYRVRVRGAAGALPAQEQVVESADPDLDLASVWKKLPPSGAMQVTAEALRSSGTPIATLSFSFTRKAGFAGPYRPAKLGYAEAGAKAANWVLTKAPALTNGNGGWVGRGFPSLFVSSYLNLFTVFVRTQPNAPSRGAMLAQATRDADLLIAMSMPADAAYPNMPPTHISADDPAGHPGQACLQIPRCCWVASTYLRVAEATGERRFLEAAERIADTLKKTQRKDGSWPFRVVPTSGKVIVDYTSDQAEAILLLDELAVRCGRKDLIAFRDRAVAWMLENPCKTFQWQQEFEDVVPFPPYQNLEWMDASFFIQYLLRNDTPKNGYLRVAEEIFRYIEDQFVEWEPVADLPDTFATPEKDRGDYRFITPGVREQYKCYDLIDAHMSFYIRLCTAFHAKTHDAQYLAKAKALADTLSATQHPDGYFPSWMVYKPVTGRPQDLSDIGYVNPWYNCVAYDAAGLLEFADYLSTVKPDSKAK